MLGTRLGLPATSDREKVTLIGRQHRALNPVDASSGRRLGVVRPVAALVQRSGAQEPSKSIGRLASLPATQFVFRCLLRSERQLFTDHLLRLSPHDRQMRFGHGISDAFIRRYVAAIVATDTIFAAFDESQVLRGACHLAFQGDVADVGLSVDETMRGHGLGATLLQGALDLAAAHGARQVAGQFVTRNDWVMAHAKRLGFAITSRGAESTMRAELPVPTPDMPGHLSPDESLACLAYKAVVVRTGGQSTGRL